MNRHVFASCLILWMAITPVRASAQDAHPSSATAAPAPCKPADELFNQGKFEEAATRYDAVLKLNNQLECAQLGIAKTLVAQGDTAMAQNTINAALEAHLGSPALLQALGDIDFRRGEMGDAERAYQAALRADSKNAKSYLGLARLYRAFSLYGHAYAAIKQAHELDPNDPDVLFLWIETLPRRERLPALKDYLDGAHRDIDREQRADMERYLQYLEKTQDQPHSCLPSDRTEKTELKFKNIREAGPLIGGNKVGYALEIKVNDRTQLLQFDTGAGGMTVSRKAAEKAGLQRVSEIVFSGIGDQGDRTGYLAVAERVKLGDLEFRDCLVTVSDKKLAPDSDGLLGSDIFASYLIDLDMPHNLIRLGPLPQRPGERAPASSLNTNGGSESPRGYDAAGNSSPLPQDRYVAPEMSSWTRFFRFGHMILVPTRVNNSKPMLFVVDTGASLNTISTTAASDIGSMQPTKGVKVEGVSGKVNDVYLANRVTLIFGRFQQSNTNAVTIDLSHISQDVGTEISGLLGFDVLKLLEVRIDYRDGLIDFAYRDRQGVTH